MSQKSATKSITTDANSVSLIHKRKKSSEKDYLDLNKKCFESNIIPNHDVNSFTTVEIKTENQIKNEILEDDHGENSFSVIEMKTEDVDTLSDDDVSTVKPVLYVPLLYENSNIRNHLYCQFSV